jgi:hypothetical protein
LILPNFFGTFFSFPSKKFNFPYKIGFLPLFYPFTFLPFYPFTFTTFIYADARKGGLTPELRPLSTIIFVLVLVMLIIINKRSEKNKKK